MRTSRSCSRNGASTIVDAEATCIAVSGNTAVIGGDSGGIPFLWCAVDNGKPTDATRDEITPAQLLGPMDVAQLPAGFPDVCPAPDVPYGGAQYADVTGGDIVVRDLG